MALNASQRIYQVIGWFPLTPNSGTSAITLNAANTWVAFSWVCERSTTLSTFRAYTTGTTGSPVAADASASLYSDSATGIPNASLEAKTASANPAANNWINWTGFTTSVTAGTRYWMVIKNLNATPAANNFNIQFAAAAGTFMPYFAVQSTTVGWGWTKLQTADGGSTWATPILDQGVFRLGFGDGTYDGAPITTIAVSTSTNGINSNRAVGVLFTVPSWSRLNVRGVAMHISSKTGSPTGNIQYQIYRSGVLLGTTSAIPVGNIVGAAYYPAYFTSTIVLNPGDAVRVVMGETTQSDTTSNRYNLIEYTWENDANSLALKPIDGTVTYTATADTTANPVVWSDTATKTMAFQLILDTSGEFAPYGIPAINE